MLSLNNQNGSVMVVAIMVLTMVTLIGISASRTSQIESRIAANDQFYWIAFYNAESGLNTAPALISRSISDGADPVPGLCPGISYLPSGSYKADSFYRQLAGFDPYNGQTKEIGLSPIGIDAQVDIQRVKQVYVAGNGAAFGSIGQGNGSARIAICFNLQSDGFGPHAGHVGLEAQYRHIVQE